MTPTFSRLLAALLLTLSASLVHAAAEAPRCRYLAVAKLPLRYTGPSLQVTTDGVIDGTPALMLVDTGAYDSFLTRTGTERRGMRLSNLGRVAEGVGGLSSIYQTRIKEFVAGPARSERGFMRVLSDFGDTPSYDAVLGAPFLLQADLEVSLATKEMKFFRPADGCGATFLAYWDADALVIPYERYAGESPNPVFTVLLNGQKMQAMIDTGAQGSSVSLAAARRAGVTPDGPGVERAGHVIGVGEKKVARWSTVFKTFQIGEEVIQNADISVIDSPSRIDVLLGDDFLRAHRVLFAASQRKLYLSYIGGEPFGQRRRIEPWLQAEADGGNADAQMALASAYGNGTRVPRDDAAADSWLEKAAVNGSPRALLLSGRDKMHKGDYLGALPRLRAGLDKLPSDRTAALWLYLARVRTGQEALAATELAGAFARSERDEWPLPIADFYLGKTSSEKLLRVAGDDSVQSKVRSCHALKMMIEWHRAHGQDGQAAPLEARGAATCGEGAAAESFMSGQYIPEKQV